ncbi:MAG: hypothetical protein COB66_01800 [Coxiella sp. (in: Bacteria)]|nr:MAG: hypothetical protein COB66_01800 [Coxiella sp. (in: g-proteobacteria)]
MSRTETSISELKSYIQARAENQERADIRGYHECDNEFSDEKSKIHEYLTTLYPNNYRHYLALHLLIASAEAPQADIIKKALNDESLAILADQTNQWAFQLYSDLLGLNVDRGDEEDPDYSCTVANENLHREVSKAVWLADQLPNLLTHWEMVSCDNKPFHPETRKTVTACTSLCADTLRNHVAAKSKYWDEYRESGWPARIYTTCALVGFIAVSVAVAVTATVISHGAALSIAQNMGAVIGGLTGALLGSLLAIALVPLFFYAYKAHKNRQQQQVDRTFKKVAKRQDASVGGAICQSVNTQFWQTAKAHSDQPERIAVRYEGAEPPGPVPPRYDCIGSHTILELAPSSLPPAYSAVAPSSLASEPAPTYAFMRCT